MEDIKYDEIEIASDTHKTKVELINQEYIEKVRLTDEGLAAFLEANNQEIQAIIDRITLTDEETAAQLQAIQDESTAIQKSIDEERLAREEAANAEKEAELQQRVLNAETIEEQMEAEKRLADWLDEEDYKRRTKEKQQRQKDLDEKQKQILKNSKETIEEQLEQAKEYQEKQNNAISSSVKSLVDTLGIIIAGALGTQIGESASGTAITTAITGSPLIIVAKIDEKTVNKMLVDTENVIKSFEKPLKEKSAALTQAIYDVTNKGMRQWHDMMRASMKSTYAMIEQEMTNTLRMAEAMAMAIRDAQESVAVNMAMIGTGTGGATIVNNNNFTVMPQETAYRTATIIARESRLGAY